MANYPEEMTHPIISSCIKRIEENGTDVEQIYIKTAKSSDTEVLKVLLEVDHTMVEWDKFDPVTVSSVVKSFLRSLPEPLFTFPLRDRVEYSCKINHYLILVITDEKERSVKLKTRVRSLKKVNQNLLYSFLNHISKLLERSDVNRLSVSSLSIVLGPILFQSSIDHIEPTSTGLTSGLGWFSKPQNPNATPEALQLEQLRLDNVISIISF